MFEHSTLLTGRTFWASLGADCAGLGPDLLVDGDMEAVGVASWTAAASATLTKQTVTPSGGKQCLRVTRNGVDNPAAEQTILVSGSKYRITGYARGDGTANPQLDCSGVVGAWAGTISTEWQPFDVVVNPTGTTLSLYAITAVGVTYVEWDQVSVQLANGSAIDYHGIQGDGSLETVTDTYSSVPKLLFPTEMSASSTSTIAMNFRSPDMSVFSCLITAKGIGAADYISVFTWTGRVLAASRSGLTYVRQSPVLSNNTWHRVLITKTLGQTQKIYIDGVDVTTAAAASLTAPANAQIGVQGALYPFAGDVSNVGIWDRTLTDTEIATDFATNRRY